MARPPAIAYVADGEVYELFISVRSTKTGTTVSLAYSTRLKGDGQLQGHRWVVKEESPKPARSLAHLTNLAAWACRQASRGSWTKVR